MAKIFVGMSGGVDSTVAAALLKQKGHEVVGVTLKLWDEASRCCNLEDIQDAKQTCYKIGIKHYVLNMKADFKKSVVDYFIKSYINGKTPNPCVICNEEIKFKALIKKMKENNFDYVATGHYASIINKDKNFFLKEAKDKTKTQEYFLSRLEAEELKSIIFPLGEYKKSEIVKIAKKLGVYVEKPESQEVCFMHKNETPYEFIKRNTDISMIEKGTFYKSNGEKISDIKDSAYFNYTLGQRKGLGISAGKPVYVVKIDAENKRVLVGDKKEVFEQKFKVTSLNMLVKQKKNEYNAKVKVRYKQKKALAHIKQTGNKAEITFKEPQFAVTPGQLAVIYKGNVVIGSGFIE
ncbi:MAG: tRNA 2-thiouridine(34) synthase MnmA [bacterium]